MCAQQRFDQKEREARVAEKRALQVRALASSVGDAKEAVLQARRKEQAAMHMFDDMLERNGKKLSSLGERPSYRVTKKVTPLDQAVAKDRQENRKLSSSEDVGDVLGAINSLPAKDNAHGSVAAHAAHRATSQVRFPYCSDER